MGRRTGRHRRHTAAKSGTTVAKVTRSADLNQTMDEVKVDVHVKDPEIRDKAIEIPACGQEAPICSDDVSHSYHSNGRHLSLKSVAAMLTAGSMTSALGSDSGVASDCSHSLYNSEDDERDVTTENDVTDDNDVSSGNVSMDFNDISWRLSDFDSLQGKDNDDDDDDDEFVLFRDDDVSVCECPRGGGTDVANGREVTHNTAKPERASTPDVTRVMYRRRNAVDPSRTFVADIEELSDDDGDGPETGDKNNADDKSDSEIEEDISENGDDKSVKSDANSEGCWINSDMEEVNNEYSDDNESESEADESENDCEQYCRQYQSHRFQMFGDIPDVTNVADVSDDDFLMDVAICSGRPSSASSGYRFPRYQPDEIDEIIDFWETDFQVGAYIVPKMSQWERLGITPSADTQRSDWNKYALYRTLYTCWVGCNRSHEQWTRRYWGKSLAQVVHTTKAHVEKVYPSDCTDIVTDRGIQMANPRSGSRTESRSTMGSRTSQLCDIVRPSCSRSVSNDSDTIMGCPLGFYDVSAV